MGGENEDGELFFFFFRDGPLLNNKYPTLEKEIIFNEWIRFGWLPRQ